MASLKSWIILNLNLINSALVGFAISRFR
jgi:hypothetical protein